MSWFIVIIAIIVIGSILDSIVERFMGLGKYVRYSLAFVISAVAFLILHWITKIGLMITIAKICGVICVLVILYGILKVLLVKDEDIED